MHVGLRPGEQRKPMLRRHHIHVRHKLAKLGSCQEWSQGVEANACGLGCLRVCACARACTGSRSGASTRRGCNSLSFREVASGDRWWRWSDSAGGAIGGRQAMLGHEAKHDSDLLIWRHSAVDLIVGHDLEQGGQRQHHQLIGCEL